MKLILVALILIGAGILLWRAHRKLTPSTADVPGMHRLWIPTRAGNGLAIRCFDRSGRPIMIRTVEHNTVTRDTSIYLDAPTAGKCTISEATK